MHGSMREKATVRRHLSDLESADFTDGPHLQRERGAGRASSKTYYDIW